MIDKNLYEGDVTSSSMVARPLKCKSCGSEDSEYYPRDFSPEGEVYAICKCGGEMKLDWGKMNFSFNFKGPGKYGTKKGQLHKRERTKRSERLAKTQWDNHQPLSINEGSTVQDPTPGGVYDPDSKFNRDKSKTPTKKEIKKRDFS